MESSAVARYVRISPQKVRLVMDQIRGKRVEDALNMLKFAPLFSHILNAIHTSQDVVKEGEVEEYLSGLLLRHCCYEKRKKRINYPEHLALLASLA